MSGPADPRVARAREEARRLYAGEVTPHRSCGIAIAETFGHATAPYQALRRGGLTGCGECGVRVAARMVLGERLGDPDPTGPVTPALRAAVEQLEAAWPAALAEAGAPDPTARTCNELVARFPDFRGADRHRFCTAIAAHGAERLAEALAAHGALRLPTPTLTTARLVLRPIQLGDADAIQRGVEAPAVCRELSAAVPFPYPPGGAAAWLRDVALPAVASGDSVIWAIATTDAPDEAIGVLEYRRKGIDNRGFWLAEPYWGRGLMTEAVIAFQDWVFFEEGVDAIQVCNAAVNSASRRVKEKTGAEYVGERRLLHNHGGDVTEVWRVTRERWAALRGRASAG